MAAKPQRPIPAATFGRNFGRFKDEALAKGIVEVSSNGRPVGAYLSQDVYERFLELERKHELVQSSETG